MNGQGHYLEAEELLRLARPDGYPAILIAAAQAHATLALAHAAAASNSVLYGVDLDDAYDDVRHRPVDPS